MIRCSLTLSSNSYFVVDISFYFMLYQLATVSYTFFSLIVTNVSQFVIRI